jgi:pyrimidine-nucleoside phosphorylase
MNAVEIIIKKRDGLELTGDEIAYFINGLSNRTVPDYQAAAWLMAVMLNGMNERETTDLTLAMADSGDVLDLSDVAPIEVDKHSTGGVGDKTTLVVEPLVAACGLPVGKMSGRGLGFSGGTWIKLRPFRLYDILFQRRVHALVSCERVWFLPDRAVTWHQPMEFYINCETSPERCNPFP